MVLGRGYSAKQLLDLCDNVLMQIVVRVDYDLFKGNQLLRVNKRFRRLMDGPNVAARLTSLLLTHVVVEPTEAPYRQLNVDRILAVVAGHNGAVRDEIMRIAHGAGPLHSALLVRAPHLKLASERRPADAKVLAARALFIALLPSIIRTIESESIGGRGVYRYLSSRDLTYVISKVGCAIGILDRGAIQEYAAEMYTPLRERRVLAARGPLCFWECAISACVAS
jgi:hypothetical protein